MKTSYKIFAGVATLTVAALAVWFLRVNASSPMQEQGASSTPSSASAVADPSLWSIAQGEDATRRHIREGLKAGDVDPTVGQRIRNYHDPMVPGKNFDAPGKSPFMEMMLVPRYAGGNETDASSVTISPRIQQNLGLRTAPVVEGALATEIVAVGNVAWNERDQQVISARAMGFVEKLHVRAALDPIGAGAPLADLYFPDWVAVQEEYLAITRMNGPDAAALHDASRRRMRQAGMEDKLIERVIREGKVQARVTLTAPMGGIISELMVREGATVMAGMPIARVQGTQTVWAEGQVPESQAALLKPGARVRVTSPAVAGQTFDGRVQSLLPEVDATTRTLKARLQLSNPGSRLVPGMFVQMRFDNAGRGKSMLVPTDAVIHTGRRSVVMLADEKGGFRPVEVKAGIESGGQTEIVEGLSLGQRVVLSGQFLIDSEASLRGLEAKLNQKTEPSAQPLHQTGAKIKALSGDTVTLDHPPIASLKWPQMVMDFRLPSSEKRPRDLAAGEQVQIEFHMQDGDVPQITSIQRIAPGANK